MARKEYWSIGILECWEKPKAKIQPGLLLSVLHYSITPLLPGPTDMVWTLSFL
jgi:hypothetical protein